MPASKRPTSVIDRPAALLVVESEAVLRDALAPAADALKQGLISQGYDVVVYYPDEARHLLKLRSFDKIYGDRTFLLNQDPDRQAASSGPKVEDLGNGTA